MRDRTTLTLLLSAAAALLGAGVLPSTAQAPSPRIVVLDSDRVTQETAVGRQARDRILAQVEDWQQRVETKRQELADLMQRRRDGAVTLNDAALMQLDEQIDATQVDLERLQDDARRAIDRLQQQGANEVNRQLVPILDELARQRGYELVLDARLTQIGGLLFFSPEIDVTDEFIAEVDARLQVEGES